MISRIILTGFLLFVLLVSLYDSWRNLDRYNVRDEQGIAVTWKDNLSGARDTSTGLYLDKKCMESLRENPNLYGYLNSDNITDIISSNYERKTIDELSDDEMEQFFQIRAATIYENLVQDSKMGYTNEEIASFMDSAESLSALSMGYAEGWKILAEKMGNFVFLLATIISALVLPLFGRDPAVRMEELVRSSRYGKRQLDTARMVAAYMTSTVLYVCSIGIYFAIVMLPFGFDGANQPIQSNVSTFFSLYNITYLQQFLLNLFIGYVVLIFMVSLALFVTILFKNILASGSVIAFFLAMLVVFDQVYLYPVNHMFANFMPVRMTDFLHFYTGNELYRICGFHISCMIWSIIVSLILSGILFMVGMAVLRGNRKKRYFL
jgi:hypothetical protein